MISMPMGFGYAKALDEWVYGPPSTYSMKNVETKRSLTSLGVAQVIGLATVNIATLPGQIIALFPVAIGGFIALLTKGKDETASQVFYRSVNITSPLSYALLITYSALIVLPIWPIYLMLIPFLDKEQLKDGLPCPRLFDYASFMSNQLLDYSHSRHMEELLKLPDDKDALFELATIYRDGRITQERQDLADFYFLKAQLAGHNTAKMARANMYLEKARKIKACVNYQAHSDQYSINWPLDSSQKIQQAIDLYLQAAVADSSTITALVLFGDQLMEKESEEAIKCYESAAKFCEKFQLPYPRDLVMKLASIYSGKLTWVIHTTSKYYKPIWNEDHEDITPRRYPFRWRYPSYKKPQLAAKYYELGLSKDLDHAELQYELATRYENGDGLPQNTHKACEWYTVAANHGHREAQYRLAGLLVKTYPEQARSWYEKAAIQGHIEARYCLACLLEEGIGGAKDLDGAQQHYQEMKNEFAALGDKHFCEKDYKQAKDYYEKAIKCGHVPAFLQLAHLYLKGNGVEQDKEKAIELSRQAAAKGSSQALAFISSLTDLKIF